MGVDLLNTFIESIEVEDSRHKKLGNQNLVTNLPIYLRCAVIKQKSPRHITCRNRLGIISTKNWLDQY